MQITYTLLLRKLCRCIYEFIQLNELVSTSIQFNSENKIAIAAKLFMDFLPCSRMSENS